MNVSSNATPKKISPCNKMANFFCLVLLIISGCANTTQPIAEQGIVDESELLFIDIDSFDKRLEAAMEGSVNKITIRFPGQSVTSNDIPVRLQKWLSAADSKGKGLSMQSTDGIERKNILAFLPILPKAYEMLKSRYQTSLVSNYEAVLYYNPSNAAINEIVFNR